MGCIYFETTYIKEYPTITEIYELNNAGAKLVGDKTDTPMASENLEVKQEGQIKKLRQVILLMKENYTSIYWNEKIKIKEADNFWQYNYKSKDFGERRET